MYNIGDIIICTWGINKGRKFIVTDIIDKRKFGCISEEKEDNKTYLYTVTTTIKA